VARCEGTGHRNQRRRCGRKHVLQWLINGGAVLILPCTAGCCGWGAATAPGRRLVVPHHRRRRLPSLVTHASATTPAPGDVADGLWAGAMTPFSSWAVFSFSMSIPLPRLRDDSTHTMPASLMMACRHSTNLNRNYGRAVSCGRRRRWEEERVSGDCSGGWRRSGAEAPVSWRSRRRRRHG
jgi:hypothetical protein